MMRFMLSVATGAMLLVAGPVTQANARPEHGRDRDRFEHGRDRDHFEHGRDRDRFEHGRWWGDYGYGYGHYRHEDQDRNGRDRR